MLLLKNNDKLAIEEKLLTNKVRARQTNNIDKQIKIMTTSKKNKTEGQKDWQKNRRSFKRFSVQSYIVESYVEKRLQ